MHRHLAYVLVPIALSAPALAQACELEYPVRTPTGAPSASSQTEDARLSSDGRWVAWADSASDLVPGGTPPGGYHVFLRDRQADLTQQLDVGPNGEQPNGITVEFDMSPDARWVALATWASNLVPGDANGRNDIVLLDRQSSTREIASVNDQGAQTDSDCHTPSLSPDGRFVAFASSATNLDPLDTDTARDIYVRDRLLGTTRLASIDANGVKGTGYTRDPRISADGRYVTFLSIRTDWFPESGLIDVDVFRKDMQTGVMELVSATHDGVPGNGNAVWYPWISPDGRYVAFNTEAGDMGPRNGSGTYDVFLRDMQAGVTTLLSTDSNGQPAAGHSFLVGITPDRTRVAFSSTAHGLAPGDNGSFRHVYAKDLTTGFVTRVDQSDTGTTGNGNCYTIGAISADGTCVAFIDGNSNLVPGVDPQGQSLFLRECPAAAGTPLCFGDGTGTACPCSNSGAPGHGCANPVRPEGALLSAFGTPSVANDTIVLAGDSTTNSAVTYFQGTNVSNGIVFGDGLVCVSGSVVRLGVRQATSGASRYPGPGGIPVSVRGQIPAGGAVRNYQIWYRIAANYCTPATWSFSNAYQIAWSS
jgi:Tol biopolymer transport system component